jgi:hypothetical protein
MASTLLRLPRELRQLAELGTRHHLVDSRRAALAAGARYMKKPTLTAGSNSRNRFSAGAIQLSVTTALPFAGVHGRS